MIGNPQVLPAQSTGGLSHLLNGGDAVAPRRVHVKRALEVSPLEQARQGALVGALDLTQPLAQLGRNEGQIQLGVEILLARDRQALLAAKEAVLVDRDPARSSSAANLDVVGLGAGKVMKGGSEFSLLN